MKRKTKWVSIKWKNKLNAKQKINYVSNNNGKETK